MWTHPEIELTRLQGLLLAREAQHKSHGGGVELDGVLLDAPVFPNHPNHVPPLQRLQSALEQMCPRCGNRLCEQWLAWGKLGETGKKVESCSKC